MKQFIFLFILSMASCTDSGDRSTYTGVDGDSEPRKLIDTLQMDSITKAKWRAGL